MRVLILTVIVVIAAALATATHFHARPPTTRRHYKTELQLPNGRIKTTIRSVPGPLVARRGIMETTDAPIQQAKSMIFAISNYCNLSLPNPNLQLVSQAIMNGGWSTPPPPVINSFFRGEYSGFEAKVDPGQIQPAFNGSVTYSMGGQYNMPMAFALVQGEWEFEVESLTKWHLTLFSSEYDDVAVYNIGLGDLHFVDKPIC